MVSAPESSASARDRGRFGSYTRLNACPHGCVPSGVSGVPLRVGGETGAVFPCHGLAMRRVCPPLSTSRGTGWTLGRSPPPKGVSRWIHLSWHSHDACREGLSAAGRRPAVFVPAHVVAGRSAVCLCSLLCPPAAGRTSLLWLRCRSAAVERRTPAAAREGGSEGCFVVCAQWLLEARRVSSATTACRPPCSRLDRDTARRGVIRPDFMNRRPSLQRSRCGWRWVPGLGQLSVSPARSGLPACPPMARQPVVGRQHPGQLSVRTFMITACL
jgi:hypothetical protein